MTSTYSEGNEDKVAIKPGDIPAQRHIEGDILLGSILSLEVITILSIG